MVHKRCRKKSVHSGFSPELIKLFENDARESVSLGFSDQFIKQFKAELLKATPLRDIGRRNDNGIYLRYTSDELERFRSERPQCIERYLPKMRCPIKVFPPAHPTYDEIAHHLINRGDHTLYAVNSSSSNLLILCLDIDAKNGEDDAQALAQYVGTTFLNNQVLIEPSISGSGRHCYFKLCVKYGKRERLWELVPRFVEMIQRDGYVRGCRSRVDTILGLPTLWNQPDKRVGRYEIVKRGTPWQLPYMTNDWRDLSVLQGLEPMSVSQIEHRVQEVTPRTTLSISERDMGGTLNRGGVEGLNGFEKKVVLISQMLRDSNGSKPDLDEAYRKYMAEFSPSGKTPLDVKRRTTELKRVIEKMTATFKPSHAHGFQPNRFLDVVKKRVPTEEFEWSRRETLDHRRLADFVAVKVQDAFFKKEGMKARASRDATIANFRVLKQKGLVSWICTSHQYSRLLKLAVQYDLLEIVDEYTAPLRSKQGDRVGRGIARMIGPGPALAKEYEEFRPVVQEFRRLMELVQPIAA